MKIGQEIVIKENFKINTIISEKVMTVKAGDKGFLDSKGFLNLITGKGKGKIVKVNDIEVKGYDHRNIAKMILKRLGREFDIEDYLEDNYDINMVLDEIEDVLMDIL